LRTATISRPQAAARIEMIGAFLADLAAAREIYGAARVLNMDETSWKDMQMNGRTIAPKAKPVKILVPGNSKVAVTAICTVSMAGDKYPPLYILRWKTDGLRESLGPAISADRVTVSHNGWMDESVMLRYLSCVHIVVRLHPFTLVLDSFGDHDTERIRRKAVSLVVQFIPVQKGMTG
jgi:hypothetical protein